MINTLTIAVQFEGLPAKASYRLQKPGKWCWNGGRRGDCLDEFILEAGPYLRRRDPEPAGRVGLGEVRGVQPSAFNGDVGGAGEGRGEPALGAADLISCCFCL